MLSAFYSSTYKTRPGIGSVRLILMVFFALILGGFILWHYANFETRKIDSSQSLRELGAFYRAYTFLYDDTHPEKRMLSAAPGDTAHTAILLLAQESKCNDGTLWIIREDPSLLGEKLPKNFPVYNVTTGKIDPRFAELRLGYVLVANLPLDVPATTTPIAWTRGLRPDGTWAPDSPWRGQGGHILYLDGHVEWIEGSLKINPDEGSFFVKFGTNIPTVNIHEALPPGTLVLPADPPP